MSNLSPQLLTELNTAITRRHLDSVAGEIRSSASECYAMVTVGDDDYSSIGNTRFGGDPDLPAGVNWPVDPEKSQPTYSNFIAQINFAELPPLSIETGLPNKGILYLFVRYMEAAYEPVILDSLYFDGSLASLSRRPPPDNDSLCDEYLVDLAPQRIQAVPSVSLPNYSKQFRQHIEDNTQEVDGLDGDFRRIYLTKDLCREGQIGQMLGFANAGDERDNLYRHVVLGRLGKRRLIYNDCWKTMQEYEAYIEQWRNDERLVKYYQDMREDVEWLTLNREMISSAVDQWRLLFQLESNLQMNLNINDADPLYVFIQKDDLARAFFSDLAGEVTQG